MASMDEYKAVHGGTEPAGPSETAGELGYGGCNFIFKAAGGVIGRWISWKTASPALDELQKFGGLFEYQLQEFHEWVSSTETHRTCSVCGSKHAGVPAFHTQA